MIGDLVSNLTRDDFELFEDGMLQKIDLFSHADILDGRSDRFVIETICKSLQTYAVHWNAMALVR